MNLKKIALTGTVSVFALMFTGCTSIISAQYKKNRTLRVYDQSTYEK